MKRYKTTQRPPFYRSRDGMIFGVCQGLSDYATINVFWVRLIAVVSLFMTGFGPLILIYLMAAIFMRPAPVIAPVDDEDYDFYDSYTHDRTRAIHRLKRKFDSLDRRTRQMESVVTDREYDWERRFNSGS